jgi:hypothetical protein
MSALIRVTWAEAQNLPPGQVDLMRKRHAFFFSCFSHHFLRHYFHLSRRTPWSADHSGRIIDFVHLWVFDHWIDFAQDAEARAAMKSFVKDTILKSSLRVYAKELNKVLGLRVPFLTDLNQYYAPRHQEIR